MISGRAVNLPANTGRDGTTLDIWAIDPETGFRTASEPHASFDLGPGGEFGPLVVGSGVATSTCSPAADTPVRHHLYLQPYVRSSHLVRDVLEISTRSGSGDAPR